LFFPFSARFVWLHVCACNFPFVFVHGHPSNYKLSIEFRSLSSPISFRLWNCVLRFWVCDLHFLISSPSSVSHMLRLFEIFHSLYFSLQHIHRHLLLSTTHPLLLGLFLLPLSQNLKRLISSTKSWNKPVK
jgi:hypothetical protein